MTPPVSHGEAAPNVSYPLDVEHMWEMDRLERQGRLITDVTTPFPPLLSQRMSKSSWIWPVAQANGRFGWLSAIPGVR